MADDAKKKALREEYAATHMQRLLALVDARIAAHDSGWAAGAFSIADLAVFTTCNLISSGQFVSFPTVTAAHVSVALQGPCAFGPCPSLPSRLGG